MTEKTPDGGWVDMGGQWVGPTQTHVLALIKSFGIKTFPTYQKGKSLANIDGKVYSFNSEKDFPGMNAADLKALQATFKKLDTLALTVPVDNPAMAPNAAALDSETVATWIKENVSNAKAKFMMRILALGTLASEPRDISLLHLLFYIHAAGGTDKLETYGIAQRLVGGTQQLSEKMAEALGNRVKLNSPVYAIDQTQQQVAVTTTTQCTYIGKQVIVALPPALTGKIHYTPSLPANRLQFNQRAPMGSSIKVHAVYKTPFWRKEGYSGEMVSNAGPVEFIVDNSPPNGKPGILGAFYEGQAGRQWSMKSKAAIEKEALKTFAKYFGPQALKPTAFYIATWNAEPYSGGCFSAVMPTGVWTGYPLAIRQPIGRIHWAGTATATKWFAYMDGAVSSGERAGKEVEQALQH